jgi:phosphosulfolactate phosphohydrolase-like enzyme
MGVIKTTNATELLCGYEKAYIVSTLNLEYAIKEFKNKKVKLIIVGGKYGLREDMIVGLALYVGIYVDVEIDIKSIRTNIQKSKAANHLERIGYRKDIEYIINKTNEIDLIPIMRNKMIYKNN